MPIVPTHDEALLFHHFITHLSRWLDCTNAARIFTLSVSEQAVDSPILYQAIQCFAARHRRQENIAEASYEHSVTLLISRLNDEPPVYDELLLAAVLLLHFADQLNGKSPTHCPVEA